MSSRELGVLFFIGGGCWLMAMAVAAVAELLLLLLLRRCCFPSQHPHPSLRRCSAGAALNGPRAAVKIYYGIATGMSSNSARLRFLFSMPIDWLWTYARSNVRVLAKKKKNEGKRYLNLGLARSAVEERDESHHSHH
jgi:hypothetical protein